MSFFRSKFPACRIRPGLDRLTATEAKTNTETRFQEWESYERTQKTALLELSLPFLPGNFSKGILSVQEE